MKYKGGQIALPFILLVSGIVVEIVIAGSLVAYFSSNSAYGSRFSARAYAAAYAGLNDILTKISKDKEFPSGAYELSLGEDKANVSFTKTINGDYYFFNVYSLGKAGIMMAKLNALISVNTKNGLVNLESVKEVPLDE
jgi:hypothetical protein